MDIGYIFSDVAFDLETLMNAQHPWAEKFLLEEAAKGDVDYGEYPVVFSCTSVKDVLKEVFKDYHPHK